MRQLSDIQEDYALESVITPANRRLIEREPTPRDRKPLNGLVLSALKEPVDLR